MTTAEEPAFVPTFSHQPPPGAPAPEVELKAAPPKLAPYASLGAALAVAAAALEPTFVDGGERVTADRLRSLRHVRDQLPSNAHGALAELRDRTAAKLLRVVDGWSWSGPNLLILGPTRVGKTSGAALLVRLLLDRGAASTVAFSPGARRLWGGCKSELDLASLIRWQSCRALTTTVREFPLGQGTPETIQRCQHARLLVLDDIGSTDDRGALERILDVRYERRWPTVTTSGLTSGELVRTFGDAMVRRMSERAGLSGLIVNLFPAGPRA